MVDSAITAAAVLGALQEPALVIARAIVVAANPAAKQLLGEAIEGRDVRLAIRHPQALEHIVNGIDAEVDLTGLGQVGQPWSLSVREIGPGSVLVRLFDRAEMVSAEKMRVDFVANASHELRTPLAAISGYAETLAEDGEVPAELRQKFASTMVIEAKRMLNLIEDLMSLSRIQADRFAMPTEPVAIEQVVRTALGNVEALRGSSRCQIEIDIQSGLPPIRGDAAQLVQVIDNLVSNAIRYGCGPTNSTIFITVSQARSWVTVSVRDKGQGIAREHLPRLTERFYRVDAGRSRHSGGTGLGLAIVKHVVERHRGTLDIKSEVGVGTSVTLSFPADNQTA